MKRIILGIAATTVCASLLLTACGGNNNAGTDATTAAVEETTSEITTAEAPDEQAALGGWTVNDKIEANAISADAREAFDKAIQGYTGMNLEPAALLATQVVAGTNYLYLCKGEPVVQNPTPGWYLVEVYKDLDGNAQITMCEEVDINDIKTADATVPSDVVGGWAIMSASDAAALPEEIWGDFNTAAEAYADVTLSPLALLATQMVNGTNYKILCQGTTTSDDATDGLYVATLYVNSDGSVEMTEVEQMDLLAYLDQSQPAADAEVPAEYADYVGYQFAGTDPWGGEMSITIRGIEDGTMEATFTDVLGEGLVLYSEMAGIPVSKGEIAFSPSGQVTDDDNVIFSYIGWLDLKDGELVFTYESGDVITRSEEGDSSAYQVGALEDGAKSITLTKTADPDAN